MGRARRCALVLCMLALGAPLVGAGVEPAGATIAPATPAYSSVAAGEVHSCAVTAGTIRCWGDNSFGQLGDGTTKPSAMPKLVPGLTDATAVAVGVASTCALRAGGTVVCWGYNVTGGLGDGTTTTRLVPTPVSGLSGVVAIDLGRTTACARLSNGTVRCWGGNAFGQIGDGTTIDRLVPTPVSGLASVSSLSVGDGFACASLASGAARCWGANSFNQLGDGTSTNRPVPVSPVGLSGVTSIAAGGGHGCAVVSGATVKCWGQNGAGQLGDGTTAFSRSTPVVVSGLTSVAQVTAGSSFTCARRSDGSVRCWGSNLFGQVGDGTTTGRVTPVPLTTLSSIAEVSAGLYHACSRTSGGTVRCWGRNAFGEVGDGTLLQRSAPTLLYRNLQGATAVVSGDDHSCALMFDGTVRCWGANASGQLGDGTTTPRSRMTEVQGVTGAIAIAAGAKHTCALLADRTARCWGENGGGQLGDSSTTDRSAAVTVLGLNGAVAIDAGEGHTCALMVDRTARCWGANGSGQLGDGSTTGRTTPGAVSGLSGASQLGVGVQHACAVVPGTGVRCWGEGGAGQLGVGSTSDSLVPVTVASTSSAAEVLGGSFFTCARFSPDGVKCWGQNSSRQLGDGTGTSSSIPTATRIDDVIALGVGSSHSCAVLESRAVECWGFNSRGQLGDGTTSNASVPVAVVGLADVLAVAPGSEHTCALVVGGSVRCWGDGGAGQLGNGSTSTSASPVLVPTRPGQPAVTVATPGSSRVTLGWAAPASTGGSPVVGYVITPYIAGIAQAPIAHGASPLSRQITGLVPGTAYTFRVAAVNAVGQGYESAASPVAVPTTTPAAPSAVSGTRANASAIVSWVAPADGGSAITGYTVTPYLGALAQTPVVVSAPATSKLITGLTNGSSYTFRVAATNANGTGPASAASNVVVPGVAWAPFGSWSALVRRVYLDLTAVAPTSAETATWERALSAGSRTKGDLVEFLRRGDDNANQVDPMVRLYRAFLGRAPDRSGLVFWVSRRRTGSWTLVRVADSFAGSSEFSRKYGSLTNDEFVRLIYEDVLERPGDEGGIAFWAGQIDSGRRSRGAVMVGFSESSEYQRKQAENTDVAVAYAFLLGRMPTAGETSTWTSRQRAGTPQAFLASELLDSSAYTTHITG